MKTIRFAGWLVVAGLVWGSLGPVAEAQNVTTIDRRMGLLVENSQRLVAEINAHYRQVPQFGSLSTESAHILTIVAQIRGCLQSGDIPQATRDLCEVERRAKQIQNELDGVDQFTSQQRVPRPYRVHTRPAFRTAQFVEDYAVDLKVEIRDLPRRPLGANSIAPAYPSNLLPTSPYRSPPPVLENPRPQTFNYPPAYPLQRLPGQTPVPSPAIGPSPGPDPSAPAELLPEPRSVPLQAPDNANPPAVDRST